MSDFGREFLGGLQVGFDMGTKIRKTMDLRAQQKQAAEVGAQVQNQLGEINGVHATAKAKWEDIEARLGRGEEIPEKEVFAARVALVDTALSRNEKAMDVITGAIAQNPGNAFLEKALGPVAQQYSTHTAQMMKQFQVVQGAENSRLEREQRGDIAEAMAEDRDEDRAERKADRGERAAGRAEDRAFRQERARVEDLRHQETVEYRRGRDEVGDQRAARIDDRLDRVEDRADRTEKRQREAMETDDMFRFMSLSKSALAQGHTPEEISEALGGVLDPEQIRLVEDRYAEFEAETSSDLKENDRLLKPLRKAASERELTPEETQSLERLELEEAALKKRDRFEHTEKLRQKDIARGGGLLGELRRFTNENEHKLEGTYRLLGMPWTPEDRAYYDAERERK